jgi:putative GTP pyrophosphokinase
MPADTSSPKWKVEYGRRQPGYERLATEVEFALDATTRAAEIKLHSVVSRVKPIESLEVKARQKEITDPLTQITDIVGARVVVLFLSDLPRLDRLIRETFTIHSADDKISSGDPASFGYMSVHYTASLGENHRGPRYDGLGEMVFEIQARTIVMDAWANVSHYLDYKGSPSIPEELRRDFFALSGLFYVADQHFEMLADRAEESQEKAVKDLQEDARGDIAVNLDTVQAFLVERYPDRDHTGRRRIAEFVDEIVKFGYEDLAALEVQLDRAESRFLHYEHDCMTAPTDDALYADLAVARLSLALADQAYAKAKYPQGSDVLRYAVWAEASRK